MNRIPDSHKTERPDADSDERTDPAAAAEAPEDPSVCPACHRHVCGEDSGLRTAEIAGFQLDDVVDVNATADAGAAPATRADFVLNPGADDDAIRLLFPNRDANRLGQWGPYEIQSELGRGGMGIVFKGLDLVLHRAVAIKVMNPALSTSRQSRARFVRESRVMAAIRHPNIVAIHAVDQHGGIAYLVMEYVRGEGLDERIRRLGRLPVSEVLRIGALIADGLEAAHAQGTIHRDVKPANVLLGSENGEVKISDFGLALVALENSDLTPADRLLGTPAYTAPEQIQGKAVDSRADLFSLGCLLHAMAVGYSPFAGRNVIEVAHRVCDQPPRRLDEIDPSIPRSLADLTLRLLEKDPDDRLQTAKEAALALRSPIAAEVPAPLVPVLALRAGKRRRDKPSRRARTWVVGGLLLIAAAILFPPMGGFAPPWRRSSSSSSSPLGLSSSLSPSSSSSSMALPDPAAGPMRLVVSARSPAHFKSLGAAIDHATPGSTIQLLEGEYQETIRIENPEKSRNLTIEAAAGAVLRTNSEAISVLEIRNTPGVVIRGLTIRCSSPLQHGVQLHGDLAGGALEAVRVEQVDGARAAAVYANPGARGTPDAPLRLRGLDVAAKGLGVVLGSSMGTEPVCFVRVEDCRIRGQGHLIVLETAVHDAIFSGNIIVGGESGLSLALTEPQTTNNIEVCNNTFLDCKAWVNLGYTNPEVGGITIARNLVLDCNAVVTRSPDLAVVGPLWFQENLWRKSGADVGLVARSITEAPLLSTDPLSPDYLRPADPASVSVTPPANGGPAYAGAVAPRSAATPTEGAADPRP